MDAAGGVRRCPMADTRTAHISTTAAARHLTSAATTSWSALIQAEGVNRVWRGQRFRYLDLTTVGLLGMGRSHQPREEDTV